MTLRLEVADALHLPLDDESVDAIVCDPHYVEIARRRIARERPMRMNFGEAAL